MSNFVVSARKYRPARFVDVVGQQHVSQTLKNALQNDHLAHAFLFCGPRGVGKTTCARILAKVLNCQNITPDHEPCNTCESCKAFNENASFNITELDAASNNSVEHIRALIEQVRFQPQQGKYKVFIIDEVHMLSQQAFNAFLKTLEEPPSYAIFILATTEKHKIIPTILSRCQIFDFKRIQVPAMVEHLQAICEQEGITADKDALHIIAQKADGALRDSLSIFDRIVSFSGKKISYEDVITNLNVLDYDYFFRAVDSLLTEDVSTILLLLDEVLRKGFDADIFINGLAAHLRNLLVCKDEQTIQLLELSENLKQRYLQQAQLVPASFLLTALNLANDCDLNFKMARNKRLHVEMTLIKMTYINRAVKLAAQPEKKTLDSSSGREVDKNKQTIKVEREVANASSPSKTPSKNDTSSIEAEKKETTLAKKTTLKVNNRFTMPKVKGLDALVAEVKDKENEHKNRTVEELTLARLTEVWQQYSEQTTQKSVENVLKTTELKLDGQNVIAVVGSNLAEHTLRQERDLVDFIREQVGHKNLALYIQVDKSKAPQKVQRQKPLTPKETYIKMREVNPNIQDLQQRFGLRFDDV